MIAKGILDLLKEPGYQELNTYYQTSTVFNILGLERNENRHSAFIAWLLNPAESHLLGEGPIRRFLTLIAANTYYADGGADEDKCFFDTVRRHLLTGKYSLNVESVSAEQSIIGLAGGQGSQLDNCVDKTQGGLFKTDSQNRFDIWMLLHVTFENADGSDETWTVPLIVENKIYSKEANAGDSQKAQTVRYKDAMGKLCSIICGNKGCQPLMVYLTPEKAVPTAKSFIPISYQDLLDCVITPSVTQAKCQAVATATEVMLNDYVRNLSCPCANAETDKCYSILAIAASESDKLERIYYTQAFKSALCAMYAYEAKTLLGNEYTEISEDPDMMEDFWNANENLFKVVLYNHFRNDADKMAVVNRIIKVCNRDNTRYTVISKNGVVMNEKPASKSEASFLIFKSYCEDNPGLSMDDLRKAFPCKDLNANYYDRYLQHLFYDIDQELRVDADHSKHKGELMNAGNGWDFYTDKAHRLPCDNGNVRSVKMWRKGDFDKLVAAAKKYGIDVIPSR